MFIISVVKEQAPHEHRCAITVDAVKKYVALGAIVRIEAGAGETSGIHDDAFKEAGAEIATSFETLIDGADLLLCVQTPDEKRLKAMPARLHLVGMLSPYSEKPAQIAKAKLTSFALELLPRISRAQSMDVLSSQSNLAGYRAVIDAVATLGKATPMMMTAAGTVPPAKALVLGAGVAGLQAIATAKRLGAVVSAFDVRPAVKEQVQSLSAKFIEVESSEAGETSGGYAKEMSEDYKRKQAELVHETLKTQDIVITTALIPGKPAPELITEAMIKDMKSGAVIVDMAVSAGGNYKGSKADETVSIGGVKVIGYSNIPSRVAQDATALYARNLYNFISTLMVNKDDKTLAIQWDDELIKGTLLTKEGSVVHPALADTSAITEEAADESE